MDGIKLGTYNECPGAYSAYKYLHDNDLDEVFEIADAERQYWQNNDDTLVLRMRQSGDGRNATFNDGLALGRMNAYLRADEFDTIVEDYRTYFRLWWD
jgi:hypothetical protein